ncbi:MAG: hypothetical protein E7509_03600 [Ruminococcus sp.]|nr:hypothetical protein [Ruminococcus sp.]
MKKISPIQLITLLFVTRAFLTTTYGVSQYKLNVVLSLLSAMVAIALQLLLIIPPLVLTTNHPDKGFMRVVFERSKTAGTIVSVVYSAFFFFETVRLLGIFSYFLKNQFLDYLPAPVLIIALSGVGLYGVKCGIQGLARTAGVAVFLFVAMFFVIIFSVTGQMDIFNIQIATPAPQNTAKAFFGDIMLKTAGSDELVALVFFLPHVRKNKAKATFSYMGIKLFVTETMILYSALILGDYATGLSQPFYTLSTYAKTSVIERYDSIYMCIWTIGTVVKVAVLMFLLSKTLSCIRVKKPDLVACALPTLTAIILAMLGMYDSPMFRVPSVVFAIGLGGAIPLIFAFRSRKKEEVSVG